MKSSAGLEGGKRVKSVFPPFSEQKWDSQVRAYVEVDQKLTRDQWRDLVDAADAISEDEEGNGDGTTAGSEGDLLYGIRANLRMSFYQPPCLYSTNSTMITVRYDENV